MGSRFVENSTFWKQKKTGMSRVNIKNVLTQHGVRDKHTDYVVHTTKTNTCFGVRQDAVLVCDETQSIDFDRRSRWLSCGHTQEHMWTCDMKTGSLTTTSCFMQSSHHYVCEYVATRSFPTNFSLCRMQKYMNKTRHVTCELPCEHDKHNQIAGQMRVFVLVAVQARCQFFSLWHTLRACACVKHECLCRRISCDTSTDLLPNPGLPVLFSDTLDSFLPSPALCSHNPIEMLLLGTPKKSRDTGISNKSCLGKIFTIPKTVTSREISDIQKVFELTDVFDQIFQFFVSENQIETPLLY